MADPNNSISVAAGSLEVFGNLTNFVAAEGDLFLAGGYVGQVARLDSPFKLTLTFPWGGPTLQGTVAYSFLDLGQYWRSIIPINKNIVNLIGRWDVASPFKFDAYGTLAERDGFNDQPAKFVYLALDDTRARLYIKLANTNSSSDWSNGIPLGAGGQVDYEESLESERLDRISGDAALEAMIRAVSGAIDGALRADLNAEITRATGEDAKHDGQISTLRTDLTSEVNRAIGSETAIRTDLSAEVATARANESQIQTSLTTEVSRSIGKDNQHDGQITLLRTDLTSETASRVAKDSTHDGQISLLRTDLTIEAATRSGKDNEHDGQISSLRTDLTTETSARTAADIAHDNAISALASYQKSLTEASWRAATSASLEARDLVSALEAALGASLTGLVAKREQAILSAAFNIGLTVSGEAKELIFKLETAFTDLLTKREQALRNNMLGIVQSMSEEMRDTCRQSMRVIYASGSATGLAVPDDAGVIHLFWFFGQSLALGATAGNFVSTTALYPARALMPKGGLHSYGGFGGFVPLIEQDDASIPGIKETFAASTINHLIKILDTAAPSTKSRFAAYVGAKGSQNLYQLRRGSDVWNQGISAIREAARVAGLSGVRVIAHIVQIQGENDQGTGPSYANEMIRVQQDASVDLRDATGQREEPILFFVQTNAVPYSQAPSGPQVQMAQLAAAAASGGRIVCCGPMYEGDVNPADHIHKTSLGSYKCGPMAARAIAAALFGRGHRPLQITRARFVPPPPGVVARILCDVYVPVPPLVKDVSGSIITVGGMAPASTGGIDVYDDTGAQIAVSAVTVIRDAQDPNTTASAQIAVDLAALPPTAQVMLTSGGRRDDASANTNDGPVTGARTLFRDSAGMSRLGTDGSGTGTGSGLSHNWLVQQGIIVDVGPYVAASTVA